MQLACRGVELSRSFAPVTGAAEAVARLDRGLGAVEFSIVSLVSGDWKHDSDGKLERRSLDRWCAGRSAFAERKRCLRPAERLSFFPLRGGFADGNNGKYGNYAS
jgi:hypothetical protein